VKATVWAHVAILPITFLLASVCESEGPDEGNELRKVDSEPGVGEYIEERFGNYTMRCTEGSVEGAEEARSIGSYVLSIYASDDPTKMRLVTELAGVRDGMIQNCWISNIDDDENAEVLIFSRGAGSGGYAQLHVYEFDGASLQQTEIETPPADLLIGYQGRDNYKLVDGVLYREFPVYLRGDANCCPKGGNATLEFDAAAGVWKQG
jgi:hypothetical protein